jgi:hypothetical protein
MRMHFPSSLRRQPSVAVATERGARRRHWRRTYGLNEGWHGNQRDHRENSDKLLHDVSPTWISRLGNSGVDGHSLYAP